MEYPYAFDIINTVNIIHNVNISYKRKYEDTIALMFNDNVTISCNTERKKPRILKKVKTKKRKYCLMN